MAGYYGFTLDVRVSDRPSTRPPDRQSYARPSVRISFPDDNLSKHQWIFTKLSMCIDIVEIWFGTANGQISSNFEADICRNTHIFSFPDNNLSKCQGILTKLCTCIDIKEVCFWIANGQISSMFDSYLPATRLMTGYYS